MPRKKRTKKPVLHVGPLTVRALKGEPGAWLWRAEFYPPGGQGKLRTKSMSRGRGDRYGKDEAMDRAIQLLADGVHLEPTASAAPDTRVIDTVRDLLEAWIGDQAQRVGGDLRAGTFTMYRTCAKRLVALPLGSVRLDEVQATHCSRAVTHLRASYSDSTASQTLLVLRMSWRWGMAERILTNPFPGKVWLKRAGVQHMPTVDDVMRTLDMMRRDTGRALIPVRRAQAVLATEWMFYTGARPGEVALAHIEDIDRARSTWRVRDGDGAKSGERIVPLHPELVSSIAGYVDTHLSGRRSGPFWPPTVNTRSTTYSWSQHIKAAASSAGVEPWSPKGLRHLAVTRMLAAGIDVATAASITGHSAEVLLRSYAHVLNDRRQAAVQALAPPVGKVVPFRKPG